MYETGNELQEEMWKIHKYMELQHYASEQPMNWRRNQRRKKIILRQMRMENNIPKLMKYSKSESKRDVSRDKQLHYPRINNLNWYHKELDKEEQTKSKVSGRKKVTNVRGEISEIEDLHK